MNTAPKNKKKVDVIDKKLTWSAPAVGTYPSRAQWVAACWGKICASKELLAALVTAHEREIIVLRAATLDRLAAGVSYREIGKELWVSPQTISGIKKALAEKHYRSYLNRSVTERKKRKYDSSAVVATARRSRPEGRPRRTKYGTVYVKY